VNSFHQFAIDESGLSSRLKAIARAKDGTIEAVSHDELPQFGVMWHPEREESLAGHDLLMIRSVFGAGRS
jgi:putative glutamine amidotransferase